MEGRRNHDHINDRAKPRRNRSDNGDYLHPQHVNNPNRSDEDYLKPQNRNNQNSPDNGYLELGGVNNQTIGNSGQYDIIDYDLLNKKDPRHDQHTYRGLQFDVKDGTRKDTTAPHRSDKVEVPSTAEHKKGGNRVFILIIVVLVVLLVAMAATFGVLYTGGFFDKDGSSDAQLGDTTETPAAVTTTSATLTTTTAEPLSIGERCQSYDGLIPHPSKCQAYYNCSDTSLVNVTLMFNFEPYLNECPYPELFNTETMACEYFETVDCGNREEAKDRCDYRFHQCKRSHCIPCTVRYPRCRGKDDGFNVNDEKTWSPYYILCYKERLVTELNCPTDPVSSLAQWFSPEYNACVPLDRIPWEHNGYKPNCTGKEDGRYPNNYGRCNYYVLCAFGQYVGYVVCPDGTAFDEVTKTCTETPYTDECDNNRW